MRKSISSLNTLYKLVAREISGQASQKEKERVDLWKNSSPKATEEYTDLKRIWRKRYFAKDDIELVSQKEANEKIWDSVFAKDEKKYYKPPSTSIFISFVLMHFLQNLASPIVDC